MKPDGRKASEQRTAEMLLSVAEVKAWLNVSNQNRLSPHRGWNTRCSAGWEAVQDPCVVSDRPAGSMVQQRVTEQSEDSKIDNICRTNYIG